jgi:hypothetical protein
MESGVGGQRWVWLVVIDSGCGQWWVCMVVVMVVCGDGGKQIKKNGEHKHEQ